MIPSGQSSPRTVGATALAIALLRALRPLQWLKNGVVLAALVFGMRLGDVSAVATALVTVVVFCGLSSAMYLVNDLRDLPFDRLHPIKRLRPVASGELTARTAIVAAIVLLVGSLAGAASIGRSVFVVATLYAGLVLAYSWILKRIAVVDVLAIATGFVLRAVAGGVAIDVPVSPWLLVCTFLLALLLGFGKRRHELVTLANAGAHRRSLNEYTLPMLDQFMTLSATATVIAYALYTIGVPTAPPNYRLLLTLPFAIFAVLRYLFLVHAHNEGGTPEALLFRDWPLALAVLFWGALSVAVLYADG